MNVMEIVLTVVAIGLAVAVVALVVVLMARKPKADNGGPMANEELAQQAVALAQLKAQIEANQKTTESQIALAVSGQMERLLKSQAEAKDSQTQSLEAFRRQTLLDVQTRFGQIQESLNRKLTEGFQATDAQMANVNKTLGVISQTKESLDRLEDQVVSLNAVLTNSQKRGRFGEVSLEGILNQVFGDTHHTYATQYQLSITPNGVRPDAVVFLPGSQNVLCIDSKFSFAAYGRLFQKELSPEEAERAKKAMAHAMQGEIDKIAKDYVVKGKTAPYAIMYVPSDGIYAMIQSDDWLYGNVVEYARKKSVVIVSPSTLQPVLANINLIRQSQETRENIDAIIAEIGKFQVEAQRLSERWNKFSKSVDTMVTAKQNLDITVNKLTNKATLITDRYGNPEKAALPSPDGTESKALTDSTDGHQAL